MDLILAIGIIITTFLAGIIGSLFGIGGGMIIIPALTLVFGIPMKDAIGASLVGVIATSTGAASRYVWHGYVNIRLGMIMEPATTFGSIVGAAIAIYLNDAILAAAFGFLLLYGAYNMIKRPEVTIHSPPPGEKLSDFYGVYYDNSEKKTVRYEIKNIPRGIGASLGAGITSGLLGIGGGLIKVPAMNVWMGVPMRAATATSNFMIGVTALAGAIVYYANGFIEPALTGTVVVGIFFGAVFGTRISKRVASSALRKYFSLLMLAIMLLMFARAAGINLGM